LKDLNLRKFDQHMSIRLSEYIDKHQPDVIYERCAYLMDSGSKIARLKGIPHLLEVNAPYPEEKVKMEGRSAFLSAAEDIERNMIQGAKTVFTVSTAMKDYLKKRSGTDGSHIHVVPNAVGDDWLNYSSKNNPLLRSEWSIERDEFVVGFVGSIFPYHGVDRMIQAASSFARNGVGGVRMLIVGDGEIVPQLKQMAKDLGVEQAIKFTGNVPHNKVKDLISIMDVCVMPRSNWYGSPVKIFEYGALGKCIIGPDVVPVVDVMKHREDGLLIQDMPDALYDAIQYLRANPLEKDAMALRFKNKVHSQFTWSKVAQTIMNTAR
jgi:glycosyltransferase involved in cell wall biosynthesis